MAIAHKKYSKSQRWIDVFVMVLLPIVSFVLVLSLRTNLFVSSVLFFGVPSIYLSLRNPRAIAKTASFSFLLSVPLTFIFDYLLVRDQAWYIHESVFPFRLFGIVALEQFVFAYLWIYFMVAMYEHFFDRRIAFQKERLVSKPMLLFSLGAFFAAFVLMVAISINSSVLVIPYAYGFFGLFIGIIPILLFLWHFPMFYTRFIRITVYFLLLALLMEYAGLTLNQWTFPGSHYLWTLHFFGFRIPLEEVLFYFVLSTPGALTYYEYLDDDRK